jgi:Glycosyltransferase family 87
VCGLGAPDLPRDRIAAVVLTSDHRRIGRGRELRIQALLVVGIPSLVIAAGSAWAHAFERCDFVNFYTLAVAAWRHNWPALVGSEPLRELALAVAPAASHDVIYPAVYPPQVGAALAPLGALSYPLAYVVWALINLAVYLLCVRALLGQYPALDLWRSTVWVCVAVFPPMTQAVLNGHLSMVALTSVTLAALALARGARFAAGCALGLLGYKYSLLAPAMLLLTLTGEWQMLVGASVVAAAQYVLVTPIVGLATMRAHVESMVDYARRPELLRPKPYMMHSLRTFWALLLPGRAANFLYAVSGATVLAIGVQTWRRAVDQRVQMGVLALLIVLISPHVLVYDLVILVPAFLIGSEIALTQPQRGISVPLQVAFFAPLLYLLVRFVPLQISTVALVAILLVLRRVVVDSVVAETPPTPTAPPVSI